MSDIFLSHPDKPYIEHITRMLDKNDLPIEKSIKVFHDVAKLKPTFQSYIKDPDKFVTGKNHSLLSAYIFLSNYLGSELEAIFGFLAIVSHHGDVGDLDGSIKNTFCLNDEEIGFANDVLSNAKTMNLYADISFCKTELENKIKLLQRYLRDRKFKNKFDYFDFISFKGVYSNLIYSDKYEAIFDSSKASPKDIDISLLERYIQSLKPHKKRDEFRRFVLNNFDENHKLFTLTAPTGYGKTLTALNFALKFKKDRIIFTLPFTTIIDQTYDIISEIYAQTNTVFKMHHKTSIDESLDADRYSKIKFIMNSFSADINITTLYQLIFAIFGNSNKDNVKFNQLKNSVVIIDEAQAIPYEIRKDFLRLCEIISQQFETIFIFMSATMPVVDENKFKEISNLRYFGDQKRYDILWLEIDKNQDVLEQYICEQAKQNHTLVVVNTAQKAQELYYKFKDKFECFSLTSYMTDEHKRSVISRVQNRLSQNNGKILLISTQSIEAGVDVSFEVGFREIAPISSIIQTAGRINRHFGEQKGKLYVFDDICKYSDLIYGKLQTISNSTITDMLKNKSLCESEILDFASEYFKKININLEHLYLEYEMQRLEFFTINSKIKDILEAQNHKFMLIIEPEVGFVDNLKTDYFELQAKKIDKFDKLNKLDQIIKKITKYSVNITKNDIDKIDINLPEVVFLKDVKYLPFGAEQYNDEVGFKKEQDQALFSE